MEEICSCGRFVARPYWSAAVSVRGRFDRKPNNSGGTWRQGRSQDFTLGNHEAPMTAPREIGFGIFDAHRTLLVERTVLLYWMKQALRPNEARFFPPNRRLGGMLPWRPHWPRPCLKTYLFAGHSKRQRITGCYLIALYKSTFTYLLTYLHDEITFHLWRVYCLV